MKKMSSARISQFLFLLLFLVLFIQTEYRGHDNISAAVNSFFRADPLVLASYLAAVKSYTPLLFPALLMIFFTLLLGRFFCGWICPLGTLIDLLNKHIGKSKKTILFLKGDFKYWLLISLLVSSMLNVNLAGMFDPIAILVRVLTFFLYPLFGDTVRTGWVGLYSIMGDQRDLLSPAYNLIRDNLLPFRETLYPLSFLSAILFGAIIVLERFETRNWCKNICPLGTLLGVFSRFSLIQRSPAALCSDCKACKKTCPTSFEQDILQNSDCILCLNCQMNCPNERIKFNLSLEGYRSSPFLPQRRVLLGGLFSGLALSGLFRFRSPEATAQFLRPPGVRDESDFLRKCVRCGECMKVCLKNALYPAAMQAGIEGLYTPLLIPRLGYCEFNCTLCGQVCPTAAIPNLALELKQREVIGKAVFNKNHCLPFARTTNCIVCEEHCPIPNKAIRSRTEIHRDMNGQQITLKIPYIVYEICNGCGICENVCPLEGKAGIEVFSVKDKTPINLTTNSPTKETSDYQQNKFGY
jgi:polyferredoxin